MKVWTCVPERCRGTKRCPMTGYNSVWRRLWGGLAGGCAKTALATARRTGVTEAGVSIATEDGPRGGEQYGARCGGGKRGDGGSCNRATGRKPRR